MDYLEGLFGVDTFNKRKVTSTTGTYLKYVHEMYRIQLHYNTRYEHPLTIPGREWKAIIEDTKEKKMRKEGKMPTGPQGE